MGGADKSLDMGELVKLIPNYCKKVILLPGSGTDKIRLKIKDSGFKNVVETKNLKEAVSKAKEIAKNGDAILFSPAFASFGQFKNEYDRGEQFNKIIGNLQ